MSMSNQELLANAGQILESVGVRATKAGAVMTSTSMATGDYMDRKQVERLVDLTVSQSGWLSAVKLKLRTQRSGEIPRMRLDGVVTEGVSENAGATITSHPVVDNVPYQTAKFQATWYLTIEELREARASGEPDSEAKIRAMFAKAMGNDLCKAFLRGNTALAASSRLNRLLRTRDGILKKARAAGIVQTTGRGAPFDRTMFTAMQAAMPEEYREDPDLRWFLPSLLDLSWTESLADPTNAQGSAVGDAALLQRRRFEPIGIPQLIVPQLPTDQGFDTVTASTVAANSITDNGANLTANVNNLFGGYAAKWAGRRVRITLSASGASEVATVVDTGSALTITTSGTLGQATISTTAADYALDLADLTTALLTNPANLFLVMCDQVRSYRKFEQEFERWRIDVFYDADFGVFNENAIVVQDGVVTPSHTFGSGY